MKKKTIFRVVIATILLLVILKGLVVLHYCNDKELNVWFNLYVNSHSNSDLKIKHKIVDDYVEFEGLFVEDIFSDYDKKEMNDNHVVFFDKNDEKKLIMFKRTNTLYKDFTKGEIVLKENNDKIDMKFYPKETRKFLESNNVKNQNDLDEFLLKGFNINIFTSINDLKAIYTIKNYLSAISPYMDSLTKLTGDVNGQYIKYSDTISGARIYKDDYFYDIIFLGFDNKVEDDIVDLVSTIK